MTRVADTSFLMALFDGNDPRRADALGWLADPEPIQLLPEVAAETVGVTHKRFGFDPARRLWKTIRAKPHVTLVPNRPADEIARRFTADGGRLSWVDAAVVSQALAEDAHVLCFDRGIDAHLQEARRA